MRVGPPGRQPGPRSPALQVPGCSGVPEPPEFPELPELPELPDLPEEPLPPMFGQLAWAPAAPPWFGRPAGGVAGFDGSVVVGADEAAGAGLAADTAATAPPMTSSAASEAVRTVRRSPTVRAVLWRDRRRGRRRVGCEGCGCHRRHGCRQARGVMPFQGFVSFVAGVDRRVVHVRPMAPPSARGARASTSLAGRPVGADLTRSSRPVVRTV